MRRSVFGLVSLCGALALASTASAWTKQVTYRDCNEDDTLEVYPLAHTWRTMPVRYVVWAESAVGISAADAPAAVTAAFEDWDDESGNEFFSAYDGVVTSGSLGNDTNEVLWLDDDWAATFGAGNDLLALTFTISDRATGMLADAQACPSVDRCETCPAAETDIFVNGAATESYTRARLHTILAHEVGHLLGLGHEDDVAALMDTTPTEATLTDDDRDGLRALYPEGAPLCEDDDDCVVGNFCSLLGNQFAPYSTEGVSCPRTERCGEGMCHPAEPGETGTPCLTYDFPACEGGAECSGGTLASRGYCGGERIAPPNPCEDNPLCEPQADASTGDDGGVDAPKKKSASSGGCAVAMREGDHGALRLIVVAALGARLRRRRRRDL